MKARDAVTLRVLRMVLADARAAAVDQVIADISAASPSDLGRVMGELMSRHKGRLDGKAANTLVRDKLQSA